MTEASPDVAPWWTCLQTPAFLCRQTDFIRAVAQRQAGEHQEGPVPGALGHEERGRQGAPGARRSGLSGRPLPGLRARRRASATTTSCPTCAAWRSCATRRAGRFDARTRCKKPGGLNQRRCQRDSCRCWPRAALGGGGGRASVHGDPPTPPKRFRMAPNAVPLKHMKSLLEQARRGGTAWSRRSRCSRTTS